ncbi:MAG: hypothetical protein KatS3mg091_104 [Patescibacteria group bacterium]|nr:MAG: hypothetical protein KatS3mg091_104 [Patescibacteria group bacterium]
MFESGIKNSKYPSYDSFFHFLNLEVISLISELQQMLSYLSIINDSLSYYENVLADLDPLSDNFFSIYLVYELLKREQMIQEANIASICQELQHSYAKFFYSQNQNN